MALLTYTLTGNLDDLLGEQVDVSRVNAWIESSVGADGVIYNRDANSVLLGDREITLSATGAFSISGLIGFANLAADVNPTGIQYRVWLAFPEARSRKIAVWNSGWFSMSANADLSDVAPDQYLDPTYQGEFFDAAEQIRLEILALRDETEALRDEAGALVVADLGTTDGQTTTLLTTPSSTSYQAAYDLAQKALVPYVLMGVI